MKQDILASLRAAIVGLLAFTVLTGVVYPAVVYGIGQVAFAREANGDPNLVGQAFTNPAYFWGRPSAIGPFPYNAMTSSGTNQGMGGANASQPLNPALRDAVAERVKTLQAADPGNASPIPADLVTSSASGLDPHISPEAAYYQAGRVARLRGMDVEEVRALVAQHTEGRTFGVLGEPRVNVVAINRALDARKLATR
ncbi:MAG: potassium-transporting ATPase subunit KdpC [Kofleriaceae bacterium]|nr:potassium-transporting ATPase subunit KdpC [Kofleriaceae bacterium]